MIGICNALFPLAIPLVIPKAMLGLVLRGSGCPCWVAQLIFAHSRVAANTETEKGLSLLIQASFDFLRLL